MRQNIKTLLGITTLVSIFFINYSINKLMDITYTVKKSNNLNLYSQFQEEVALNVNLDETDKTRKIDWHDYEFMKYENSRKGIGENGSQFELYHMNKTVELILFEQNGFNAVLSDKISLNRSLPDIRHKDCRYKMYSATLPKVSIVIPFYNEHWSTLLRTCYSLINRSPSELLTEIILVDDCSTKGIHCFINYNFIHNY